MTLQERLRLDATIALEEGQPLSDFISRREVERGRWPESHTIHHTPAWVCEAIGQELWPDL